MNTIEMKATAQGGSAAAALQRVISVKKRSAKAKPTPAKLNPPAMPAEAGREYRGVAETALAKAALGRGGMTDVPVLIATDNAGGIKAYSDELQRQTGITDQLTQEAAKLKAEVASEKKIFEDTAAALYSVDVLQRQKTFWDQARGIQRAVINSGDQFKPFVDMGLQQVSASAGISTGTGGGATGSFASGASGDWGGSSSNATAIDATAQATNDLAAANKANAEAEAAAATDSAKLVASLNGAATGAEIAEANFHKLSAAFLANKFGASDSADAIDKFNRALHGDTANQVAVLQDQRAVIEAIGNAAKMAAQYAADYNAALRGSKDQADALQIAAEKLANSQAAAVASVQQGTQNLQQQNQLQQAGYVSTVGMSQVEAARAQAGAIASQSRIASEQAYDNAIKETGKTQEGIKAASAKADEVSLSYRVKEQEAQDKLNAAIKAANNDAIAWQQNMLGVSEKAMAAADASQKMAESFENAARAASDAAAAMPGSTFANADQNFGSFSVTPGEQFTSTSDLGFAILRIHDWLAANYDPNSILGNGQGIDAAISATQKHSASDNVPLIGGDLGGRTYSSFGLTDPYNEANNQSTVKALYDLKNAQTTDKNVQASDLSAELAWLQTQPETIARDQNIVSLMNSINQLKQATDSNTAATAATLNPLYSQGHGALAIGYYKAATGLDGIVQGPSGVDQVPVHMMLTAGERVQVTPQGQSQNSNDNSRSSHTTIVQSFDFRGAQSNSRRSSRQYAQGFGQTAAAMS